jgi:hypothetical protein
MLHEGVRRDDEVAREPAADEQSHRGRRSDPTRQPPLAPDEDEQEAGFEEEREEPLHRQRLPDHAARVAAEPGPVGAELELHGNAGDHPHREVDAEDPDPEARGVVPTLPARPQAARLHEDDQEGQPHGELREQVVIDDRERKLEAVKNEVIHQRTISP